MRLLVGGCWVEVGRRLRRRLKKASRPVCLTVLVLMRGKKDRQTDRQADR